MKTDTRSHKERLRAAGLSATRQRVALLRILSASSCPRPVERLATALRGAMNLATVYRGLEQFVSVGLAHKVVFGEGHALYEAVGRHHHHVVCRSCGRVEDTAACLPSSVLVNVRRNATAFAEIEGHTLEFFGTCKVCA